MASPSEIITAIEAAGGKIAAYKLDGSGYDDQGSGGYDLTATGNPGTATVEGLTWVELDAAANQRLDTNPADHTDVDVSGFAFWMIASTSLYNFFYIGNKTGTNTDWGISLILIEQSGEYTIRARVVEEGIDPDDVTYDILSGVALGTKLHVAGLYDDDAGTLQLFVNGQLVHTLSVSVNDIGVPNRIRVFEETGYGSLQVTHLFVSNGPNGLTSSYVGDLYNNGSVPDWTSTPPVPKTHFIEYESTSGESQTLKLFAQGNDTLIAESTATEAENRKGTYVAGFSDLDAGVYQCIPFVGSDPRTAVWVKIEANGTYTAMAMPLFSIAVEGGGSGDGTLQVVPALLRSTIRSGT